MAKTGSKNKMWSMRLTQRQVDTIKEWNESVDKGQNELSAQDVIRHAVNQLKRLLKEQAEAELKKQAELAMLKQTVENAEIPEAPTGTIRGRYKKSLNDLIFTKQ